MLYVALQIVPVISSLHLTQARASDERLSRFRLLGWQLMLLLAAAGISEQAPVWCNSSSNSSSIGGALNAEEPGYIIAMMATL